ncbi:uncharacterized protein BDZ83DRAFT_642076 [Colletotrichum acutatum]|uniref:Uncharacterized protein n=1 Tax=Glomerella acutata TaxID=27357 RepID=A0AAD8U6I4_GLOAC|nr:uncharacterized protein BDZ83DRAFT_642076 [Colletotrichum acutatum]KAK1708439.1 hypothetical protein BDZ83DRAFT_642076 [Colletotrichum acutatum]
MQNGQYRHAAEMGVPDGSSRTILEFFINKVAQVYDNRPFGSTITSLAIIQKPDKVQYIFASNQRSSEDAQSAATTIQTLLDKMGSQNRVDVGDDDRSPVFRELLHDILLFHKQRVTLYKSRLNQRLNQCIKELKARSLDAGMFSIDHVNGVSSVQLFNLINHQILASTGDPLLDELEYLQALTQTEVSLDDSQEFARNGEHLISAAKAFRKSPIYESAIERAREGRFNESERWCELQHFIGRLSSYHGAVRAIISGRRRLHPDLFENFEITWLPSSIPMNNPMDTLQAHMGVKTQQKRRSADNIIRRMMANSADRDTTLEQAKTLQVCGLDESIMHQCQKTSFKPIVHCEILLLHYLDREYGRNRYHTPFFDDVRFIGCSKPTCRLCEYYFDAHNTDIQVRPGHKNVYSNWAIPNLFANDLAEANERDSLLDKVVSKIREDALRALKEKISDGKRHDSNTHSSYPTHQSLEANVQPNMEGLAFAMEDLTIIDPADMDDFQFSSDENRSIDAQAEESETDEDDWAGYGLAEHSGGVSL